MINCQHLWRCWPYVPEVLALSGLGHLWRRRTLGSAAQRGGVVPFKGSLGSLWGSTSHWFSMVLMMVNDD